MKQNQDSEFEYFFVIAERARLSFFAAYISATLPFFRVLVLGRFKNLVTCQFDQMCAHPVGQELGSTLFGQTINHQNIVFLMTPTLVWLHSCSACLVWPRLLLLPFYLFHSWLQFLGGSTSHGRPSCQSQAWGCSAFVPSQLGQEGAMVSRCGSRNHLWKTKHLHHHLLPGTNAERARGDNLPCFGAPSAEGNLPAWTEKICSRN